MGHLSAEDGKWGDLIALLGFINMLEILVAIVSSLGETGLNVIYPADYQNKVLATGNMALLGHEVELHYHSLKPVASQKPQLTFVQELNEHYGKGKIKEEICPKCQDDLSATHKVFFFYNCCATFSAFKTV